MNINATIIIQAINLFITFWIVRFLLIKPVMAALLADQEVVNSLSNTIVNEQQQIAHIADEREHMWHDARTTFEHEQPEVPVVADIIFKDIVPTIEAVAFSAQDQRSFIDQSAQKIVERLEHDIQ